MLLPCIVSRLSKMAYGKAAVERAMEINIIFGVRLTLWSLYCGMQFQPYCLLHALMSTLVIKRGIVLDWWSCELSVMLEKLFGCALITKLRSILFMESDFNFKNNFIYDQTILQVVRNYRLMPEEIYSKKNCLAEDRTLVKVLFYEVVQQMRIPAGISTIDADNCYDQISHPIASLLIQSLHVPKEVWVSIFRTVQDMIFFSHGIWGFKRFFQCNWGNKNTRYVPRQQRSSGRVNGR